MISSSLHLVVFYFETDSYCGIQADLQLSAIFPASAPQSLSLGAAVLFWDKSLNYTAQNSWDQAIFLPQPPEKERPIGVP